MMSRQQLSLCSVASRPIAWLAGWVFRAIPLIVFLAVAASAPAQTWDAAYCQNLGQQAMANQAASGAPAFRTNADKLRYLSGVVGDELARQGIKPNTALWTRVRSVIQYGELTKGTCQWCAVVLRETCKGAGMDPRKLYIVFGEAGSLMGVNPLEVNSTHCGLGYANNGQLTMADLWKHGYETGSFAGAATGKWTVNTYGKWVVGIEHYEEFGWESEWSASSAVTDPLQAMQDLLADQLLLAKQKPNPAPSPTATLPSGAYSVAASGALFQWNLNINGGTITGLEGDLPVSGSISGNSIRLRRPCPGWDPPDQDYQGVIEGDGAKGRFTGAGCEPGQYYDWEMKFSGSNP